jgi:predicted nucleic acid-binding protein
VLYLDSSALVKRYFRERGSKRLRARIESGEQLFTSNLTFAEIHSALARKYLQEKSISQHTFTRIRKQFLADWAFSFNTLEVNPATTLLSLGPILEHRHLRGADAVHLATVAWLRDQLRSSAGERSLEVQLEFAVCDKQLAEAAQELGISVFNPEL